MTTPTPPVFVLDPTNMVGKYFWLTTDVGQYSGNVTQVVDGGTGYGFFVELSGDEAVWVRLDRVVAAVPR